MILGECPFVAHLDSPGPSDATVAIRVKRFCAQTCAGFVAMAGCRRSRRSPSISQLTSLRNEIASSCWRSQRRPGHCCNGTIPNAHIFRVGLGYPGVRGHSGTRWRHWYIGSFVALETSTKTNW